MPEWKNEVERPYPGWYFLLGNFAQTREWKRKARLRERASSLENNAQALPQVTGTPFVLSRVLLSCVCVAEKWTRPRMRPDNLLPSSREKSCRQPPPRQQRSSFSWHKHVLSKIVCLNIWQVSLVLCFAETYTPHYTDAHIEEAHTYPQ